MTIEELLNQYGLLVVIVGVLSFLICGALKVPISKKINSLDLTEKEKSQRLTFICTAIVTALSAIIIIVYYCVLEKSFEPLLDTDVYLKIAGAFAVSKASYAVYQGGGKVSLKEWLHELWNNIFIKIDTTDNESEPVAEPTETAIVLTEENVENSLVDKIQSVLINRCNLPMTDEQKAEFLDGITEELTTKTV